MTLARFEQIERYLPIRGDLLDLGCGYGVFANYLALGAPERSVIGIDMDEQRIEIACRTVGDRTNISFAAGDVSRTALPECDAVIVSDFMHHLSLAEQERLLARTYSALRNNGILLIQEVNTRPRWKRWFSQLSDIVLYPFDEKLHFRSPEEWVTLLKCHRFREIQVLPGDAGTVFARVSYTAYK